MCADRGKKERKERKEWKKLKEQEEQEEQEEQKEQEEPKEQEEQEEQDESDERTRWKKLFYSEVGVSNHIEGTADEINSMHSKRLKEDTPEISRQMFIDMLYCFKKVYFKKLEYKYRDIIPYDDLGEMYEDAFMYEVCPILNKKKEAKRFSAYAYKTMKNTIYDQVYEDDSDYKYRLAEYNELLKQDPERAAAMGPPPKKRLKPEYNHDSLDTSYGEEGRETYVNRLTREDSSMRDAGHMSASEVRMELCEIIDEACSIPFNWKEHPAISLGILYAILFPKIEHPEDHRVLIAWQSYAKPLMKRTFDELGKDSVPRMERYTKRECRWSPYFYDRMNQKEKDPSDDKQKDLKEIIYTNYYTDPEFDNKIRPAWTKLINEVFASMEKNPVTMEAVCEWKSEREI